MTETKNPSGKAERATSTESGPWHRTAVARFGGVALAVLLTLGAGVGLGKSMSGGEEEASPSAASGVAPATPDEEPTTHASEQPETSGSLSVPDSNVLSPEQVEPIEDTISPVNVDKLAEWAASPIGPAEFEPLVDEAVTEDLLYNNGELTSVMERFQLYDQFRFEGNEGMWREIYDREFFRKAQLYGSQTSPEEAETIGKLHYITRQDVEEAVDSGDATELIRQLLLDTGASNARGMGLFAQHMVETKGEPNEEYLGTLVADAYVMGWLDDIERSEELGSRIEYGREMYFAQGEKAFLNEHLFYAEYVERIENAVILDVATITVHVSDHFDNGDDVQRQTFLKILVQTEDGSDLAYNIALVPAPVEGGEAAGATQAVVLDRFGV